MSDAILEWVKVVGHLLLSWPLIGLVIVLVFRSKLNRLFERFLGAHESKAEFGPIKLQLGKLARDGQEAIDAMNRLSVLMAETRLLDLEITEGNFGQRFTKEQQSRMKKQIDELRAITASVADEAGG